MNLVLCDLSSNLTYTFIKKWLHYYEKNKCQLKPILYCDMINTDIEYAWPYEIVCKPIRNSVILPTKEFDSTNHNMFVNAMKLNVFHDCGPSLIVDSVSHIIQQNLSEKDIPNCKWGLIKKNDVSKSYLENKEIDCFTCFETNNFLERVDNNVQIISEDYSVAYQKLYKDNISKISELKENYPEAILSLTHKLHNGVFLCEDWAWPFDSLIRNKTIIIEQYYTSHHRALLEFSILHDISFIIDSAIIEKEND